MSIQVEIHHRDKFRIDVVTVSHPQKKPFTVDFFFFFPKGLDVTQSSYPKPLFYRYIKNNLRYRIPDQTLKQLKSIYNPYYQRLKMWTQDKNDRDYLNALNYSA